MSRRANRCPRRPGPSRRAVGCAGSAAGRDTRGGGQHPVTDEQAHIERLRELRAQARLGGGQQRIDQQHARGQAHRARAPRAAARPRELRRVRRVRHPSQLRLRARRAAHPRRRRGHRPRHHRRSAGLRLQPGLHGLRRLALRGPRREDLQGHGPGDEGRRARHRPQRLGRRAHPGGRRLAGRLRRHLPAQHAWPRASSPRSRSSWGPAPAARSTRRPSPTSRSWSRARATCS